MHEKGRFWSSYHKIEALLGRNLDWSRDLSESEKFGSREKKICRERWEKVKTESCLSLKKETQLDGLRFLSRIYWVNREHKNFSRWIEEVDENVSSGNLEISMDWEAVEILLRRNLEILDGSRICRGSIEKGEWKAR